ncbi:CHAP domain-containing protein [Emticicia aquatilis]|uniref:CHAP domain-containing protein n=1 Tax=Emticicia aquatilis TaxID=1537369 RepID=UPI001665BCA3|nr:CHAP domain-containing protein [Emticicia aquatilis]
MSHAVLGQDNGLGDSLIRSKVVNLALLNTGVCEVPVNRGKVIDKYRSVALDRKISGYTDPWCAYFIGYIYKSYGIDTKKVLGNGYIARAADWFKNKNRIVYQKGIGYQRKRKPKAGDVVGYKFTSGRISHVGILIEWNELDGYALVVEGNTTPRNSVTRDENKNDCVRLKKRPISMIYVVSNIIE